MNININDENFQSQKLAIILEKKESLKAKVKSSEKRIDEKIASLAAEGFILNETDTDASIETIAASTKYNTNQDDIFSGIDLSDDAALDQAVRTSKPESRLAFYNETDPFKPFELPISSDSEDDEMPTLSKILGPASDRDDKSETLDFEKLLSQTQPLDTIETFDQEPAQTSTEEPFQAPDDQSSQISTEESFQALDDQLPQTNTEQPFQALDDQPPQASKEQAFTALDDLKSTAEFLPKVDLTEPEAVADVKEESVKKISPDKKIKSKKPPRKKKQSKEQAVYKPTPKPNAKDMILPSFLFILGIIACGVFLVGFTATFSFIDYSVLFILLTCLIFTIALPYTVSLFFMFLLTASYGVLIIVSTFYFKIPFKGYQFGWLIIIPLILFGSTLLIRRIRELYRFKKELESQIKSYDEMDHSFGLTIEKTYYKDLKQAMDRASANEIILTVEMLSISHFDTLRSMDGSRLWDEILYKTLKIIKKHSYSTHLIYVLEGNVFSIIMENTSMKNQLMINQSIQDDFNALISSYQDAIDVPVSLKVASIPYSREINNPFDYRALGFKHLER